jgi:uncharacterized DUF497 family protein
MSLLFEWDASKARSNLKKHGISFEEVTTIFADQRAITIQSSVVSGEIEAGHHWALYHRSVCDSGSTHR